MLGRPLPVAASENRGGNPHDREGSLNTPTPAHFSWAQQCLAQERATGDVEGAAPTAAARVHDKLHLHLAPIVGAAGLELLFLRSAKLGRGKVAVLSEGGWSASAAKARDGLLAGEGAASDAAATLFFGQFFALLASFIGHRLTSELIRRVWPTIDDGQIAPEGQE